MFEIKLLPFIYLSWLVVVKFWSSKKQIFGNLILEKLKQAKRAKSDQSLHVRAPPQKAHFLKLDVGIDYYFSNLQLGTCWYFLTGFVKKMVAISSNIIDYPLY